MTMSERFYSCLLRVWVSGIHLLGGLPHQSLNPASHPSEGLCKDLELYPEEPNSIIHGKKSQQTNHSNSNQLMKQTNQFTNSKKLSLSITKSILPKQWPRIMSALYTVILVAIVVVYRVRRHRNASNTSTTRKKFEILAEVEEVVTTAGLCYHLISRRCDLSSLISRVQLVNSKSKESQNYPQNLMVLFGLIMSSLSGLVCLIVVYIRLFNKVSYYGRLATVISFVFNSLSAMIALLYIVGFYIIQSNLAVLVKWVENDFSLLQNHSMPHNSNQGNISSNKMRSSGDAILPSELEKRGIPPVNKDEMNINKASQNEMGNFALHIEETCLTVVEKVERNKILAYELEKRRKPPAMKDDRDVNLASHNTVLPIDETYLTERETNDSLSSAKITSGAERDFVISFTKRICQLSHTQRQINSYFAVPIILLVGKTLMLILLVIYTIAVDDTPYNISSQSLHVVFLLQETFRIAILCYTPNAVRDEVDNLAVRVSEQRLEEMESKAQNQLSCLSEALYRFPSCDIGGFFTLSKSRLIDIGSFVVTYLVILLQFRAAESTEQEE